MHLAGTGALQSLLRPSDTPAGSRHCCCPCGRRSCTPAAADGGDHCRCRHQAGQPSRCPADLAAELCRQRQVYGSLPETPNPVPAASCRHWGCERVRHHSKSNLSPQARPGPLLSPRLSSKSRVHVYTAIPQSCWQARPVQMTLQQAVWPTHAVCWTYFLGGCVTTHYIRLTPESAAKCSGTGPTHPAGAT